MPTIPSSTLTSAGFRRPEAGRRPGSRIVERVEAVSGPKGAGVSEAVRSYYGFCEWREISRPAVGS